MTTKTTLTPDNVLPVLREIVASVEPDYVNPKFKLKGYAQPSCTYALYNEYKKPVAASCLIGQLANRFGVPLEALADSEGQSGYGLLFDYFNISVELATVLDHAQDLQDMGQTWQAVLLNVEGELESRGLVAV